MWRSYRIEYVNYNATPTTSHPVCIATAGAPPAAPERIHRPTNLDSRKSAAKANPNNDKRLQTGFGGPY